MPSDWLSCPDIHWMQLALREAVAAMEIGEVPVGAVVVHGDRVVGRGHNQRELLKDPTAHAEILAITQAAASLGNWRLDDCRMYVTLEPCAMCAGAILQARIPQLIYGATDPKAGAVHSIFRLLSDARLNHRCEIRSGLMADACGEILSQFFEQLRLQRNNKRKE
ncbi:MAG: tRNA adenosine(34) deaminase TadA [Planctomycetota bacterium]|nr:tRNA adenosine(34) deaminase TadA [Planctomycetota bacterium]